MYPYTEKQKGEWFLIVITYVFNFHHLATHSRKETLCIRISIHLRLAFELLLTGKTHETMHGSLSVLLVSHFNLHLCRWIDHLHYQLSPFPLHSAISRL